MSVQINSFFWICLAIITICLIWPWIHKRLQRTALINKVPGPSGNVLLGISWRLLFTTRENLTKLFIEISRPFAVKYPLLRVWLGPFPLIFCLKAESAKAILNSSKHIEKATYYRYLHNWIGQGLLTSAGYKWQQRRKLITPSFHFRILENFLLVMNEQAGILVQLLEHKYQQIKSEEFDIYPYITRCTLDIICETALGQGANAQLNTNSDYVNAVNNLSRVVLLRMMRPWLAPDWIFRLSSLGRLEQRSLEILHGFTNKIIKMKRMKLEQSIVKNGNQKSVTEDDLLGRKRRVALLDMLLEKSMEDASSGGQPLTNDDIREEVDTFVFEGHDTTSVGISWALYLIGMDPNVQHKIVEELDVVFGNSDRVSTCEDLHNLKYLECVIKESQRIVSSVPLYGRTLSEDLDICGYVIPSGAQVVVCPHWVHRDPAYYSDPDTFNPDRFTPENSRNRDPFAYIPFSAGLRNCIGQKFAMMEEKVVLSQILRKFIVRSVEEPDIQSNTAVELVVRAIRGVRIQLEPRRK